MLLPTEGLRDDIDQFVGLGPPHRDPGPPDALPGHRRRAGDVRARDGLRLGDARRPPPGVPTITDAADPLTRALDEGAGLAGRHRAGAARRVRPARSAALGGARRARGPAPARRSRTSARGGASTSRSSCCPASRPRSSRPRGHNAVAAALVAVSLATKPQAIPFLVPFAAWFWATGAARDGWRGGVLELVKTGAVGLATTVVLWLPFLSSGGPRDYLANLGYYQDVIFPFLSIRAWNVWWLLQIAAGPDGFISDNVAFLGPFGLPPHRLPGHRAALGGHRDPDHPRPAPAGLLPGPGGVGPDVLHVHDPDARALRLRGGDPARAAPPGRADPLAVARTRGRVHAQPGRGDPADARRSGRWCASADCSGWSAASR